MTKSIRIYKRLISKVFRRAQPKVMLMVPMLFERARSSLYFPHLEANDGYKGFKPEANGQASREIAGFQYLNPDSSIDTSFLEIDGDLASEEDFSEEEVFED